ncbi:hypothetical protein Fmac_021647 [Flemingia macrophylla]|uniref:Secreted protein n=1 Tax=Flemingia macrophylla TaxID=520843 RepID=A0ABD1LZA3_9FABA
MHKSCILAASVAAASATAASLSASAKVSLQVFPSNPQIPCFRPGVDFCLLGLQESGDRRGHCGSSPATSSASTEKFAPRFDGLRFIETLITAHR